MYYPGLDPRIWDAAVEQASKEFSFTDHSLISNNCHHHVARVLNISKYQGRSNWSAFDVAGLASAGQTVHNGWFKFMKSTTRVLNNCEFIKLLFMIF